MWNRLNQNYQLDRYIIPVIVRRKCNGDQTMTTNLPESRCFVLLANRRRRITVRILREFGSPLCVREIARRVSEREYENPTAEDLRDIHIALHHSHLPLLEDADVVSYDPDERTVELRPNFDTLVHLMDQTNERAADWTDA